MRYVFSKVRYSRQSSPQKLIKFIQQPLSKAVLTQIDQYSYQHPSQLNPQLNQRGYPGQIASYQAELDKAIRRDIHPEGWGHLHHQTGIAHYRQLGRMLADPKRTERQKRQLALKSAAFAQLSVDLTLQSGDISGALTLAETGKNTCLRWLLGYDELPSVDYSQIQQLLTPTTAAIYWHLSPSALTTFVILPNATAPIVVENNTTEQTH
jgi:hypothetical protein